MILRLNTNDYSRIKHRFLFLNYNFPGKEAKSNFSNNSLVLPNLLSAKYLLQFLCYFKNKIFSVISE